MSDEVVEADRAHGRVETVEVAGVALPLKPGTRLHPAPPRGWQLLVEAARSVRGRVLDASASVGLAARALAPGVRLGADVLEPSAAALVCLRTDPPHGARVEAGLPWDAEVGGYDEVLLAPPGDRGLDRVRAELAAARRALRAGGAAWLLLHKDRGAKRLEREAERRIGPLTVLGRSGGWRLSCARAGDAAPPAAPAPEAAAPAAEASGDLAAVPWTRHAQDGWTWWSLPGVFAAGKVDPGTRELLACLQREVPELDRAEVLDLGCGTGLLSAWAAAHGAVVTAVDDDLAAVRSTERTLATGRHAGGAPTGTVAHSDLDAELPDGASFDLILCNPPFHVGARVRMALPAAFVAAARRRLRPGGEAWWVANAALPYEGWLGEAFGEVRTVARPSGFKVLRVRG